MFKLPKKLYAIFITTGVLLFIFVFFKILSHTYGQHLNDDTMDILVGVLIAACDTNNTLPEDHLKIVDECEKIVPSIFRLIYDGCVRESMNITELTQPFICYRFLKGSEQLTDCMLKWEWRASFVGVEVPLIRDRILNKYAVCMKPIVPPEEEDTEE